MNRNFLRIVAPLGSSIALALHTACNRNEAVEILGILYKVAGVEHSETAATYELMRDEK